MVGNVKARYVKHTLLFKHPSGTSRGVLNEKETFFIILEDREKIGIGECGLLRGLSIDDVPEYETILQGLCEVITEGNFNLDSLSSFPSLQMGFEMAQRSLQADNPFILFKTTFTKDTFQIPINGLVWMGDFDFMQHQIQEKINAGFSCIKLKIGALDFDKELQLLEEIRNHFTKDQIEIRVDANGAFSNDSAFDKLKQLAHYDIHSIEQPIARGQEEFMNTLCRESPIPIALDEELIGISTNQIESLLDAIQPQYIILKPSLLGGFTITEQWIQHATKRKIGWWITSALESNIGLSAIAQWTAEMGCNWPQGLGTGSLYSNNIPSPLVVENGYLRYDLKRSWKFNF